MLKIYNTLTKKTEEFKPIKKGEVKIYVCGPTVNDVPHLGHARQQITFDVLRKVLIYNGYKVKLVSNITDIDDKIINKARELNENIQDLTKRNTLAHKEDYEKIGVNKPNIQPKATEYVEEMIQLIKKLESKGYTYLLENDGVYYDISKFKKYGSLSGQKIEDLKKGVRIKIKEQKKNKEDFVLWKLSKPSEPYWKSPWGNGRPGWHIECSAMSHSILGLPIDIHGGGQDLIFPHHEDEIAQSEAAYEKKLANYWMHNAMVNVDNIKMSKSLGNFRTIRDLLKMYPGEVIRYFVLLSNYRKPVDFSEEKLKAALTTYERLKRKIIEIKGQEHKGQDSSEMYEKMFIEAINDDLNTPKAIQVVWKAVDDFDFDPKKKLSLLEKFDTVLGLNIKEMKEEKTLVPKEINELVEKREKARKEKDYQEADKIRKLIDQLGYVIEDSNSGIRITKK